MSVLTTGQSSQAQVRYAFHHRPELAPSGLLHPALPLLPQDSNLDNRAQNAATCQLVEGASSTERQRVPKERQQQNVAQSRRTDDSYEVG